MPPFAATLHPSVGSTHSTRAAQARPAPSASPDDENDLLDRVAAADQQAFDTLYARYAPRLQRYLRGRLGQSDAIDDVLQEVMLVFWRRADHCPRTGPVIAWLYGIARNKALKARSRRSALAGAAELPTDRDAIDPADPERIILHQEHTDWLTTAIDALPMHERTALGLLVQQECSPQEIAVRLNEPVSTVRTRLSRARHRLRNRVNGWDQTRSAA